MDDGELDFSNQDFICGTNVGELPSSSMDSFFDELMQKDAHACTHTHTCNPPGPDNSHTHTCFHVHTKIVSSTEDKDPTDDAAESSEKKSKKRHSGNREAVRKYREKKKARAASLEDEVVKLRALNQNLLNRLQGQSALEAEISRLKCLLVDIRGRIDGEIAAFPYQKSVKPAIPNPNLLGSYAINPCNMQCNDQAYCLHPAGDGKTVEDASLSGQEFSGCEFESLQCGKKENQYYGLKEVPGSGAGQAQSFVNSSNANKTKGAAMGD